ncbi:hypothetical protein H0H87_000575 [Tephrocybe sp. NHM501043]|nr:hypothetical protein H0H87_000575 [Tephrocybe sp. NHM501043]
MVAGSLQDDDEDRSNEDFKIDGSSSENDKDYATEVSISNEEMIPETGQFSGKQKQMTADASVESIGPLVSDQSTGIDSELEPKKSKKLLKSRAANNPVMQEEIDIAPGKTLLDSHTTTKFVAKLKKYTKNIEESFQRQQEAVKEPWDQAKFEDLLMRWIVASDKTFDEVETLEFQDLLNYVHHSLPLNIPGHNMIKRRVMSMGDDVIEETKKMFSLLESIGALSHVEAKKAMSQSRNYQDVITTPLNSSDNEDNDMAALNDQDEQEKQAFQPESKDIFAAVDKDKMVINPPDDEYVIISTALMILSLTRLHKDLHALELSEKEWAAIKEIASWLEMFWSATTEILQTKESMLSSTHLIFCGLQDHVKTIIANLPNNINPIIKRGLLAAHTKLCKYYYCFDQSPFYIWAAHK